MTPETLAERWKFFESKGPEYSLPIRRSFTPEGIPTRKGALYVALYPPSDFLDLVDFGLFQSYSSSIQQDLIATGALDRRWFFPDPAERGTARFWAHRPAREAFADGGDLRAMLLGWQLPRDAAWVLELDFEAWEGGWDDDSLELTAASKQGYLTLFVVDDQ